MIKSNNGSIIPGFLVIEVLISIFIGLVFVSALMRMQAILCKLNETFEMRERALALAINLRERGVCSKDWDAKKTFTGMVGQREFVLNVDELKVRVEWRSITRETCSLVL